MLFPQPSWRHRARAILVALVSFVALLTSAVSAAAQPPPDDPGGDPNPNPNPPGCASLWTCTTPPPFYMAVVGDSFWSGEGMSHNGVYWHETGTPESFRHVSGFAPPHLAWMYLEMGRRPLVSYTVTPDTLQLNWGVDRLTFNASSGAHVRHLWYPQMEKGALSTVQRNAPQLDNLNDKTNLVFFGLGGNDVGFSDLMQTALAAYYTSNRLVMTEAEWKSKQLTAVKYEVAKLTRKIPQMVANVEQGLAGTNAAAPNASIVVGLYPIPAKASGNASLPEVGGQSLDAMYPFAVLINQAIREAVANFKRDNPFVRVDVFDPNTAGPNGTSVVAGHELGQPDSYFNGVKVRGDLIADLKMFKAFQESFHPNERGGVAVGKALATWMGNQYPSTFPNGPNFTDVHTNPQATAYSGVDPGYVEDWAEQDPSLMCGSTEPGSTCWSIVTGGDIVEPIDSWLFPPPLDPVPGAPTVGGHDTPGGNGQINYGSWIIGDYTGTPTINIPFQFACWLSPNRMQASPSLTVTINGGTQRLPVTWEMRRTLPSDHCYTDTDDGDWSWLDEWMEEWYDNPPM